MVRVVPSVSPCPDALSEARLASANPQGAPLPLVLQIRHWGNVEWAHDYDRHELRARAAAATLFVLLCSESSTVKHKLLQD